MQGTVQDHSCAEGGTTLPTFGVFQGLSGAGMATFTRTAPEIPANRHCGHTERAKRIRAFGVTEIS
jgi:hypothetical protein